MEKIKNIPLPIKIIIIGCIVGLVFAGIGGIKQIAANKTNEERKAAALKASEEAVKAANERLAQIAKEYNELKPKYDAKVTECNSLSVLNGDTMQKIAQCNREKQELHSKLFDLESEDSIIRNKDYTGYYQLVDPKTYTLFYIIGGSIAAAALLGAFIIYLVKGKKTY